jgi:ligand-binding sensor domain-containing protein
MKNTLNILLLSILFGGTSLAQSFTNFTVNDGLIDPIVNSIAIENNNIRWFGTRNGISKLEGTTWTNYSETDGLVDNDVTSIAIDNQGNKWIGTHEGLSVFNGSTWTNYTTANELTNNHVTSIVIDNQNNKWISTFGGGLIKFDGTTWESYRAINGAVYSDYITSSHKDNLGQLWICYYLGGATRINGSNWTFFVASFSGEFLRGSIRSMYHDTEGNHWFGSTGWGVSKLATDSTFTAFVHSDGSSYREKNMVNAIEKDKDNNFWCGTWGAGIMKFDGTNWVNITTKNSNLIDDHVYAIKKDNQDNLWICTYGGISRLDNLSSITELDNNKNYIFPNPTTSNFSIINSKQIKEVKVFDVLGNLIPIKKETDYTYSLLNFETGIYLVEIVTLDNQLITQKLIKN